MSIAGLKYYLSSRANMFDFFASRNMLNWMSDEAFLKRKFKLRMGYELDLDNPKTFNEKLQWLKLYDRNPLYTKLVDKYEVRKYIAEKIGEEYLIPLVGGPWNSPDEIDFAPCPISSSSNAPMTAAVLLYAKINQSSISPLRKRSLQSTSNATTIGQTVNGRIRMSRPELSQKSTSRMRQGNSGISKSSALTECPE